jgi:histidinol-phosphate aminotransferase
MKRRDFLRRGGAAAGASAFLPLLNLSTACTPADSAPDRRASDSGSPLDRDPVRLLANENPLGLPPHLAEAIRRGLRRAHEYPGESDRRLREALAVRHDVDAEGIVTGHGSTDVLRMVVQSRIAAGLGLRFVTAHPTFEHPEAYARPMGVVPTHVPLEAGTWAHDLEVMREAVAGTAPGRGDPVLVYVCNPNNPTGGLTPTDDVRSWIHDAPENHFFLVDEAYFEFVDDPRYGSLEDLARSHPNVAVVRTFSKIHGMAGVRLGYAVCHPRTAPSLRAFALATGPNHLANVAGLAALDDEEFPRRTLEVNRAALDLVQGVLEELGLPYLESHTNFVMHGVNGDVEAYRERMAAAGVLVGRAFPPLLDHNRVSLGTPDQMDRWAEALRSLRREGRV